MLVLLGAIQSLYLMQHQQLLHMAVMLQTHLKVQAAGAL
jgi:hypothetical protein